MIIDNRKPLGKCPSCMMISLREDNGKYFKYCCQQCGGGFNEDNLEELKSRKSSEELQLAIDKVRWGEHAQSRNPRYHSSLANSQARLKRAVNSAIKALEEKGM